MRRRLILGLAFILTTLAGVASASVLGAGQAAEPPAVADDAAVPASARLGVPVPDPRGGPPWAVRTYKSISGRRCASVGRTSGGKAFGPSDDKGRVQDTPVSFSGSCAESGTEPAQVILAQYGDIDGAPRSVLYGFAEPAVATIAATGPGGGTTAVALDKQRTFLVVREGLSVPDSWLLTATLNDGSTRSYRR
jgi:hypothetical protein